MNHGAHFLIGIIAFAVYNYFHNGLISAITGIPTGLWLIGIVLAALGAAIPDILEPARNWSHRKLFHSRKMLELTLWIFAITAIIGLFVPFFYYISGFFLGYVSHLLADSTTKAGLPGK
jgi:membrane-bound metal-dependent hydrolase YbcI (DUF457 family)